MPKIAVGAQIFDVVFHPSFSTVYTGLLTGHVKAFAYDVQGNHKLSFSVRPNKSSCRGLSLDQDGSHLYAVGKGKALNTIDTTTHSVDTRPSAHESAINRVKHLMPWLLATGDDDGVVKLWDPRQRDSVRAYTQHFDYITDFLWLDNKKQMVTTSGDGTLSVIDVRSKKPVPLAQSEDQEDELLSLASIKGFVGSHLLGAAGIKNPRHRIKVLEMGSKIVVGTQLGILSIFNRSSGWGDCVDRIPGHPLSVDTLCSLPSDLPKVDVESTILTGSSDGLVRAVQILPTKLLGVVADHGEWPVERISIGGGHGQLTIESPDMQNNRVSDQAGSSEPSLAKRWWVGSVGHDEVLRMTDLEGFFRDSENDDDPDSRGALGVDILDEDSDHEEDDASQGSQEALNSVSTSLPNQNAEVVDSREREEEEELPQPKKRKRKLDQDPAIPTKKKKGKNNTVAASRSFFDEL